MTASVYDLIEKAKECLKKNDIEAASSFYQKIGDLYIASNAYTKALAAYQKSLSLSNHKDIEKHLNLVRTYEKLGYTYSAYEHLRPVYEDCIEQHRLDEALETALKMSSLQSDEIFPYECLGKAGFYTHRLAEASVPFQKAYFLAIQKNQKGRALQNLFCAFKLTPTDPAIWALLQKHVPGSQKLKALLAGAPKFFTPSIDQTWGKELSDAKLLLQEELFEAAKNIYKTILEKDPGNQNVQEALKEALRLQEKKEGPLAASPEDLIRALEEDLGLEGETGKNTPHLVLQTPLEELSTKDMLDVAIAYEEMNLNPEAIEMAKLALEKNTEAEFTFAGKQLIAQCLLKEKKYFDVIELLEKTLYGQPEIPASAGMTGTEKIPKDVRMELFYLLSLAFEKSHNFNKALGCLRKIEKDEKHYRDIDDRIQKLRKLMSKQP